ncbi:FAT-domain-containing protein [Ascodesmis nigricans]|uniref:Serine/threonine-protein kinase TOR n=1 Tax=Ascodesmis nigricans TaxID=341454 RepID=A0A4S2N6L0_9PEZI|nr:FAT-domain-containing protein [Ascodesmis nigricans]
MASPVLDRIFQDIRSKHEDVRHKAVLELRSHLEVNSRELSTERLSYFLTDVNRRVSEYIHSSDGNDKMGGVLALGVLIDFDHDDSTQKTTRYANYLRSVMRGNDNYCMVLAAKTMGQLAAPGGTLTSELVDSEMKQSLEWLQSDRQENRRFSAVLLLRELARNSPTLIYGYIPQILELIWVALRDPKVLIRETAAEALHVCLSIMRHRDQKNRETWFAKIQEEAKVGLRIGGTDAVHGSLLIYQQLLDQSGMFLEDTYREVCETVLRLKDHRDPGIRRLTIKMIPSLAKYSPVDFANSYLHKFMMHLQGQLKKKDSEDRGAAYKAIGEVARAVTAAMAPYLDAIMGCIKEGLAMKGRNRAQRLEQEAPIFECISMLATAVGQALTKYMHELLDLIFVCTLSTKLTQALVDLAHNIQPLLPTIQDRLLNMISLVLCGRPFKPLGSPANLIPPAQQIPRPFKEALTPEERDAEITLALRTLGSFDFTSLPHTGETPPNTPPLSRPDHILNEFVRDVAMRYVEDDNTEVREAAALTCCQLFVKDPICYQTSNHAIQVVGEVMEKLLTVAIADPDPHIRCTVLNSLDARFDRHLAKAENVRSLFLALNDEVFAIREAAITIIGRLTMHNPAYVMPSLRKTLIQLLTELEYSTVPRNKEESARLLSHLVAASQKLIKPYVEPMVTVLLPKARDSSAGVASSILAALGELAAVGGEDMIQYIPQLMPLIIETLQDQSSLAKREAALRTLGQLASNSGYVIEPYIQYPQLLGILVNIVKTEQDKDLRQETIKLMGILGALDPYKHQIVESTADASLPEQAHSHNDVMVIMGGLTPSQEEYYPTVVISSLLAMLKDPSLSQHHSAVIEAIMNIFKTLGLKCVTFLKDIIPGFIGVTRGCSPAKLDQYFNNLGILVSIVKQHIRPYLPEILQLIRDYWPSHLSLQPTMINLIESIAHSLEGEFKVYLASMLPLMLAALETQQHGNAAIVEKILHAFVVFGSSSEEYMHLIIPVIIKLIERPAQRVSTRKAGMEAIARLSRKVNISDHASRIIHPLSRLLLVSDPVLRTAALDTLCALIFQLGNDYAHFIPMINKIMQSQKITHTNYELLVSKLLKNEPLPQDLSPDERFADKPDEVSVDFGPKKLPVNQQHLKNAWEASQRSTRDDWQEWIRRFSVELLKQSPQHALRACAGLASVYYPLARDLFNAAFVSCWTELYDQFQDELVKSIETAITSPHIPPEILQILLNLAEFMEHDDKALPIDIRTLGIYAAKCHAYAKALHYKELEFQQEPHSSTIEALISINNLLQQSDAAIGILRRAQMYNDVPLRESWFEKLHRWEEALKAYQKKEILEPESMEITMGKMRCLHALGEWDHLLNLAQEKWRTSSKDIQRRIAPLAAAAAWGLGQFSLMDEYIGGMKEASPDRSFFGAILALHRNKFKEAADYINRARDGLDTELSALVGESYNRAYSVIVRVQMLAELEEIITYKQSADQPEKQETMRRTWTKRLMGCQRNVEVWQRMLKVRALVISPSENMDMWIKFSNLCRKSGRIGLAEKSLNSLLPMNHTLDSMGAANVPPQVKYARLKFMWATGSQASAINYLMDFTDQLSKDLRTGMNNPMAVNGINGMQQQQMPQMPQSAENTRLLARCYLKQGEWQVALKKNWPLDPESASMILDSYHKATQYHKDWYKAWHAWALANFEVVNSSDVEPQNIRREMLLAHVIPAVHGFFRSIALSSGSSLQDTLRLLTLWFLYGGHPEVNQTVTEGFNSISVDTWLEVIPQLIARINQPDPKVRNAIHHLLAEVGRNHPQALVYPLTVAAKSTTNRRKMAAMKIMDSMKSHSAKLVEQAEVVSSELIRVAVLWHELWHEGLEEASRLYFGDGNIEMMFKTLEPLHEMLEKGPETLREISFHQAFGRDLLDAKEWCMTFKRTREVGDLNQAWDLYYQVFRKITRQLSQVHSLDLQYVSPKLLNARDLDLAVPGTYHSGKPVVRIMSFDASFTVISSKQRPRKLSIQGSDGGSYQYALKGHEDIRQDERVMQLFGLVNTLLAGDSECFKRHLNIQQYPVIPLSQNSGLLGWVPDSDTLHVLIREYRDSRKILLNIEHRIMLQMAPDYDNLTLMQKVEVFGYAIDNTTGQDLYRVLWLKSKSSEAWLDRRTNYTRSLGVMSMVGYILGLGDRHPSNLMLHRITGQIIHIDFGDCFEVAMHRDKYPEKVPFRLTRMLTYAMEVSNIEGSFRTTCEAVMKVLRENKESLMAVLEAFMHDPLMHWRLGNKESPTVSPVSVVPSDQPGTPLPGGPLQPGQQAQHMLQQSRRRMSLAGGVIPGLAAQAQQQLAQAQPAGVGAPPLPLPQQHQMAIMPEQQNQKAMQVLERVRAKLTGTDFGGKEELEVARQVAKLIEQAVNWENLCQHYIGWCSFW